MILHLLALRQWVNRSVRTSPRSSPSILIVSFQIGSAR